MTYQPQRDSVPYRAIEWLKLFAPAGGDTWVETRRLVDAISASRASFVNTMASAINNGAVECRHSSAKRLEWRSGNSSEAQMQDTITPRVHQATVPDFRPGSTNDRAYTLLGEGPLSEAVLAEHIGIVPEECDSMLKYAQKLGHILRYRDGAGTWWYRRGDGVPPRPRDQPLNALGPQVHESITYPIPTFGPQEGASAAERVLKLRAEAPPPAAAEPPAGTVLVPIPASLAEQLSQSGRAAVVTAPPPAKKQHDLTQSFDCATFLDGRLLLVIDGVQHVLSSEAALQLYEHQYRFAARAA